MDDVIRPGAASDVLEREEPSPAPGGRRRLKILICGLNYSPDLTGIGKFSGDMGAWLAERGHAVKIVAAAPYYPDWRIPPGYSGSRYRRETIQGVEVLRCPLWVPRTPSGMRRMLHLLSFAASSLPALLSTALRWRPDLVLAVEPPLFAAPGALLAARLAAARALLHVQDLELDAACSLGFVDAGWPMRLALRLESVLLRGFDAVSSISPRMCAKLVRKGVAAERCLLFPNWVDASEIHPLPCPSPLRREFGLGDDVVLGLYSGNFGRKQGLETVIDAAALLAGDTRFQFVLCGAGAERDRLARLAEGLPNLRLMPLQPLHRLNQLLNAADIHLLPQRSDAADLVMPSKLPGMLASGRPVIAGALPGSQLYEAIDGCGIAVPPGDAGALAAAFRRLGADPATRAALGARARRTAVAEWGRQRILERFEAWALAIAGAGP